MEELLKILIQKQDKTNELLESLLNIFRNYDQQDQNDTFGREVVGEHRPDLL